MKNKNQDIDDRFIKLYALVLLCILVGVILVAFNSCSAPQQFTTVQDFHENKAISAQYNAPDTLTLIHKYKWNNGKIVSVQDMKRDSAGKWKPYGEWYAAPDSLEHSIIHGFVKN